MSGDANNDNDKSCNDCDLHDECPGGKKACPIWRAKRLPGGVFRTLVPVSLAYLFVFAAIVLWLKRCQ